MPNEGDDGTATTKQRKGHRGAGKHHGGGFKARRSYGARVLRGELRIGFSTKWWYSESGSNKLQAKIRAWRERYLITVDQLPAQIAGKVEANDDGKVSFRDIITVMPTKKVATLEGVNHLIQFHRDLHAIRTSYKYKMKLVSFHTKFF